MAMTWPVRRLLAGVFLLISGCTLADARPPALPAPAATATPAISLPIVLGTVTPRPKPGPADPIGLSPTPPNLMAPTQAAPGVTAAAARQLPPDGGEPLPVDPPRLLIPAVKLDQNIIPIQIVNGDWDLTPLGEQVGWLTTTGERPGDELAMTLVGHVNISLWNPGPFDELSRLAVGDRVTYRSAGLDYVYSVQEQIKARPDDVSQLYLADGARLLLVTCSDWNFFGNRYDERLIVTAALIGTEQSP